MDFCLFLQIISIFTSDSFYKKKQFFSLKSSFLDLLLDSLPTPRRFQQISVASSWFLRCLRPWVVWSIQGHGANALARDSDPLGFQEPAWAPQSAKRGMVHLQLLQNPRWTTGWTSAGNVGRLWGCWIDKERKNGCSWLLKITVCCSSDFDRIFFVGFI